MTPKIVPDLYEMIYCKIGKSGRATGKKAMIWECANDVTIDSIIDLSHLMLAINSSVNVIIYTLRGKEHSFLEMPKGQLISKANCQAVNSSKKQKNEFVFTKAELLQLNHTQYSSLEIFISKKVEN